MCVMLNAAVTAVMHYLSVCGIKVDALDLVLQ